MTRSDTLARALGILVFLVGIGVLVFVFVLTYRMFNSPNYGLVPTPGAGKGQSATQTLGSSALVMLLRIALLFIMALVGSLVAGRGIQLYFAGEPESVDRS
jgi:hypothetical protein